MKQFEINLNKSLKECECNARVTIWLHDENDKTRPAMIVLPGGGYTFCSDREAEPVAAEYYNRGYNTFVLYYSVAPIRHPAQLCEVALTVAEIRKSFDTWHVNPNQIAIIGFSAGGHLAAMYSTSFSQAAKLVGLETEEVAVNATVLAYPVVTSGRYTHRGSMSSLCGAKAGLARKLSCEKLVDNNTPPAFVWHTAGDTGVNPENSILYAKSMWQHGRKCELHIFPEGGHGMSVCTEQVRCSEATPNQLRVEKFNARWVELSTVFLSDVWEA